MPSGTAGLTSCIIYNTWSDRIEMANALKHDPPDTRGDVHRSALTGAVPIIQARTLTHQVYQNLKHRIMNRQLQPGARLVVDRVAQELSVSMTPVREAFRLLEQEGLLKNVPHCGAVVIELSRKDVENMFAIRRALEGLAIREACAQLTE